MKLHLVCNAHLDPVWLWEWEEGLAETLSTFRIAAEFCEEFKTFVFCHNEAVLYKWVAEYEPQLFLKIKKLISEGRWKVIGGWYIQPDCNIPSGESLVRQILIGKNYFINELKTEPETAVNFDPFGHSRGLVQILKKSGYKSYLFCRPDEKSLKLPGDDFIWQGFDGSEILAHRASDHYNSQKGKAALKIKQWLKKNNNKQEGILLLGIGNHGGGPSREDIKHIEQLQKTEEEWDICHSYPEKYFSWLDNKSADLSIFKKDLNPWAVGCYTSMAMVKKLHSKVETEYYATEKMLVHASLNGLLKYPSEKLNEALEDILFSEFHDILPGSGISEVEEYAIQKLNHSLEIISKLRARAFFSLLSGWKKAGENEFPVFVYNPQPQDIEEVVCCEFQPPEPNFNKNIFWQPELFDEDNNKIDLQLEKESCNIQCDQRKRIVFRAKLKASSMNRFSCVMNEIDIAEKPFITPVKSFIFKTDDCEIRINKNSGLIDSYKVNGVDHLRESSGKLLVINDYADPWGMKVNSFRNIEGEFRLKTRKESADFAAINEKELEPVRIIEDGKIRTVIEALFGYNHSSVCLRYIIPKRGKEIELQLRVYWMEKDNMLKLSLPTVFNNIRCFGQVDFGTQEFTRDKEELLAHKWLCITDEKEQQAFSVINDGSYGFDYGDGELRISLLRSPAYAGHPVDDVTPITRQDRFEQRMDQGERKFRFWLNGGDMDDRLSKIDNESQIKNEGFMVLCCYPSGEGKKVLPSIILSNNVIRLAALKLAENSNKLIIRLFNATGQKQETEIKLQSIGVKCNTVLKSNEIKSLAVDLETKEVFEVDLMEGKIIEN